MMRRLYVILLLAVSTAGCSIANAPPQGQRMVVSPNGEPLGRADNVALCEDRLSTWFARTDRNHDGRLSEREWLMDSETWFGRADADRDGFVTVSELTLLRRELEPAAPPPAPARGRGQSLIDRSPDPVMAADTNLDFRVSAAEFRLLSEKRYVLKTPNGEPDRAAIAEECRRW